MAQPAVTETGTVATTGTGKPDYSREVSSSLERAGLRLGHNQTLVAFGRVFSTEASAFAWISGVLASGATTSIYNMETGVVTPYTLPAGYTLSLLTNAWSYNQNSVQWLYVDGQLIACFGFDTANKSLYENRVIPLSSALFDPTGLVSHTIDFQVTNKGGGDLEGGVDVIALLEEVGTPPLPNIKTVKCKYCGQDKVVPRDTSQIVCENCGKLTIVYNLSRFGKTS